VSSIMRERATRMKAAVHERYGSPDVVKLEDVEPPQLEDDGVLVRVRAVSVNRSTWYAVMGRPWLARPMMDGLRRPRTPLISGDFAGTVQGVGKDVTDLQPGDDVFGTSSGAFAEYAVAGIAVARKPANLTFEEAAAVPVAGITALQGLRDHGGLRPGQAVLVNGASGGVGTFAVQIAKALGAEVTAVCSTRNVDQARALGADGVIDYTREDFTRSGRRYDLLFDNAGSKSWSSCRRVLEPDGTLVLVGAPIADPFFGPLRHIARKWIASHRGSQKLVFFVAKPNTEDLNVLRELIEAEKVRPVVERQYQLSDVADAFRYMGEGHARGKLVITV
jgi:NADPH:quinone reductase-like Zn-dependent oxidoreductase